MSEELEALERLVDGNLNEVNYYRQFCDSTTYIMKDKETIEKELKEGENYKAMYRLEHEKNQQLSQANLKMSKALEIIKREPSMVGWQAGYEDYEDYLDNTPEEQRFIENKEEYDLLKEVLL